MPRKSQRLEPDQVMEVEPPLPDIDGMTPSEARAAAAQLGGSVLRVPSLRDLERTGLNFAGKGLHVGRGLLVLVADQSMQVMLAARGKLDEIQDPEMFAKVAAVHGQCVSHLMKTAELQIEHGKPDHAEPDEKPKLQPPPEPDND